MRSWQVGENGRDAILDIRNIPATFDLHVDGKKQLDGQTNDVVGDHVTLSLEGLTLLDRSA